jgi:hypothetical protein
MKRDVCLLTGILQDPCLFLKVASAEKTLMLVHVEDAVICAKPKQARSGIEELSKHFKIKDVGSFTHILGQELLWADKGIMISQGRYAKDVLRKCGMWERAPKAIPMVPGTVLSGDIGQVLEATQGGQPTLRWWDPFCTFLQTPGRITGDGPVKHEPITNIKYNVNLIKSIVGHSCKNTD